MYISWLDRKLDQNHVNEIAEALERALTLAKAMQPWVAMADINKESVKHRDILKGCKMTIIGGRHRQAAYKKVFCPE